MGRRAWWLLGMNLVIPGSAQVLAGSRRLGRFGLGATVIGWVLVVVAVVMVITMGTTGFLGFATQPWALVLLQILIAFYAVLWIVLTLDTLRLTRLVRLDAAARAGVGIATAAMLVLVGGGGAYAFMAAGSTNATLDSILAGGPAVPPDADGYYNILLIGADSGADRDGLRPDSTAVLSIDATTGQAMTFGLPRDLFGMPFASRGTDDDPDGAVVDTMHELYPDGYDGHLNSVYTEVEIDHPDFYPGSAPDSSPGIEATKDAVAGALGITVQYYVLIDMGGFEQLIDALGGVTINVQERLPANGDWDDAGNVVVEPDFWIEPGVQTMNGHTALWYARSRYTTSDYDRMVRQREVQEAIIRQFDPATVFSRFTDVMAAGAATVRTDIPRDMFATFLDLAMKARDLDLEKIEFTPPTVDPEQPDYAYIQSLVTQSRVRPTPEPED
ncbi:MAG: LCP family protein [Microbacteriaceae bacterium]|nr:LCP family protein [Microbacteriaceae bacterium]